MVFGFKDMAAKQCLHCPVGAIPNSTTAQKQQNRPQAVCSNQCLITGSSQGVHCTPLARVLVMQGLKGNLKRYSVPPANDNRYE